MPNNNPIVVLDVCPKHTPATGLTIRDVGKDGTDADNDQMMDMLCCPDCWQKDETGLLNLMAAFKFSPEDVVAVRKHALRKQRGQ